MEKSTWPCRSISLLVLVQRFLAVRDYYYSTIFGARNFAAERLAIQLVRFRDLLYAIYLTGREKSIPQICRPLRTTVPWKDGNFRAVDKLCRACFQLDLNVFRKLFQYFLSLAVSHGKFPVIIVPICINVLQGIMFRWTFCCLVNQFFLRI